MGSRIGKNPGSGFGMNIPDHFSESLETFFGLKILKFFDADLDPGFGIFSTMDLFDPGSWIWDLFDPGSF